MTLFTQGDQRRQMFSRIGVDFGIIIQIINYHLCKLLLIPTKLLQESNDFKSGENVCAYHDMWSDLLLGKHA